jgi:hypothetical protein
MSERNLASGANEGREPAGDDWDAAFSRLLEGVNLGELDIPTTTEQRRARLTFGAVREKVAEQLREKLRSERLRREAIQRLHQQFAECTEIVERELHTFVSELLQYFHGGGEVRRLPDPKDGRSRSWQVLGYRSPGRGGHLEPVVSVLLTMRGVDALERGQPSLECRVSTPRNPRLVDFTVGADFASDLEDAICRAYQDILGTLRFEPAPNTGLAQEVSGSS